MEQPSSIYLGKGKERSKNNRSSTLPQESCGCILPSFPAAYLPRDRVKKEEATLRPADQHASSHTAFVWRRAEENGRVTESRLFKLPLCFFLLFFSEARISNTASLISLSFLLIISFFSSCS